MVVGRQQASHACTGHFDCPDAAILQKDDLLRPAASRQIGLPVESQPRRSQTSRLSEGAGFGGGLPSDGIIRATRLVVAHRGM
jgi:hypothetical protein